jgi:hypothetical protein
MIGMVRVISDQIMAANIMDLAVQSEYRGKASARSSYSSVYKSFLMGIGLLIHQPPILVFMKNAALR